MKLRKRYIKVQTLPLYLPHTLQGTSFYRQTSDFRDCYTVNNKQDDNSVTAYGLIMVSGEN